MPYVKCMLCALIFLVEQQKVKSGQCSTYITYLLLFILQMLPDQSDLLENLVGHGGDTCWWWTGLQ